MKTKIILMVGFAFAIGCAVTTVLVIRRQPAEAVAPLMAQPDERKPNPARPSLQESGAPIRTAEPATRERLAPESNIASSGSKEPTPSLKRAGPTNIQTPA